VISVLVPSRGRPGELAGALASLRDRAISPGRVEYLVALDADDPADYGEALAGVYAIHVAAERYGYQHLHLYWNELAKLARGDWLMMWNDDTAMLTAGWDNIIRGQPRNCVLWPGVLGHPAVSNPFPVWPAAWSRLLGYVSPVMHPDTYVQGLGNALGRVRRIPVEIRHDRPDLTGRDGDQTHEQGRGLLGPDGMVPGWDRDAVGALVAADAARIRAAGLA
jgi:hypothetical protein